MTNGLAIQCDVSGDEGCGAQQRERRNVSSPGAGVMTPQRVGGVGRRRVVRSLKPGEIDGRGGRGVAPSGWCYPTESVQRGQFGKRAQTAGEDQLRHDKEGSRATALSAVDVIAEISNPRVIAARPLAVTASTSSPTPVPNRAPLVTTG